MVLALFATIWQLTRRSGETWIIIYEIENREYNFPVSSVQTEEWCERESGEKEKKKSHFFLFTSLAPSPLSERLLPHGTG